MKKAIAASLLFTCLSVSTFASYAADPAKSREAEPVSTEVASAAQSVVVGAVNLNTADAVTLERDLIGIGQVKAKAIVDYRDANGPFASVDELLEVKGIGAATLEKNRDKLSVN